MFTRIALAAALVAATSTVALASGIRSQSRQPLPGLCGAGRHGVDDTGHAHSAPASLSGGVITGRPVELDHDRASSPSAGGVG